MSERETKPKTMEQLRDDIDSGRTGEKVPAADPAAAPLGADDEAAGMPGQPDAGPAHPASAEPPPVRAHSLSSEGKRTGRVALIAGGGVVAAIVLAALVLAA